MKVLKKISLMLIIIICVLGIILPHISMAGSVSDLVGTMEGDTTEAVSASTNLKTTMNKLLGLLQVAAGLISVVVIAMTGFQYIVAQTPDMKEELKKKMLPIIIGLVCIFGAVSIAKFILGAVGG